MPDFALCTTASNNVLSELKLLCRSVGSFVGEVPIYVLWHGEQVDNMPPAIYIFDTQPFDLKVVGGDKSRIIATTLKHYRSVLYADCDVLFLGDWNPESVMDRDGVTLSRHLSNNESAVGHFNSGFIGVSDPTFPEWWNLQPKECPGHYGDQQCLNEWHFHGIQHEFPEQQNVGFWRWWDAMKYARPGVREASPECFRMETRGGQIIYNDAPLLSVHSHFMRGCSSANAPIACTFNKIVLDRMKLSTDHRHQQLLQTIVAAGANA